MSTKVFFIDGKVAMSSYRSPDIESAPAGRKGPSYDTFHHRRYQQ
jgi:hypothetical protein